jgi:anti-sigma B factor antagonist
MTATRSRTPIRFAPPPGALCINVLRDGGVCVVVVAGELDLATAPQLKQALEGAWRDNRSVRAMLVNVRDVTFCDARGMAPLFTTYAASRRAGVRFGLVGCPPQLLRLLNILDPSGEIPTFAGLRPALARLAPPSTSEPAEVVRTHASVE